MINKILSPKSPESSAPLSSDAAIAKQDDSISKSKAKSAQPLDERFFLVGLGYDVLKTIPKILSGSFLATILSNLLKDSRQTMDEIVYKTCMFDLPSRFLCDIANTLMVRLFNGKTKVLGFKIPYIMPEISSQFLPIPSVLLARTATTKFNPDKKSAKHNLSYEEEHIVRPEVLKQPFVQWTDKLSTFFHDKVKKYMDRVFSFCLGVTSGTPIMDSEGKVILKEDGKPMLSAPKVNYKWLSGITGGTFLGSLFLLPKNAQAFGFDAVKGPWRGLAAILFTTFCRLNTTLIASSTGIHTEGKNFDACLETAVQDKTFVPMVQYFCDAAAAILSYRVPFFNGASLSMILRLVAEIPASFLKSGLMRIAKESRMTDEWSYLSHRLLKPFTKGMEEVTKPILKLLAKKLYWRLPVPFVFESGIFNPKIPYMYDVDIQKHEHEAKVDLEGSMIKTLGLFVKKCVTLPAELFKLWEQGQESSQAKRDKVAASIAEHEARIEERQEQEKFAAKLGELGYDAQKILAQVQEAEAKPVKAFENKLVAA
ncbi:MAG: hypothetical protein OXU45_00200 [Candidatus Melainabacteria bacterium]|nr:hypothetical protein [Candidatus Melainabacteria bacterium]